MQQIEGVPHILMGQTPVVRESNIFRVLNEFFLPSACEGVAPYHYVEVMTGNDVVAQCLTGLNHRCIFDLIILSEFSGSADNMRIDAMDAAKMIRVMRAYKEVPIIVVNYDKHLNNYRRSGITAWIHVHASHDEFVTAIRASILRMKGKVPSKIAEENWSLVSLTS